MTDKQKQLAMDLICSQSRERSECECECECECESLSLIRAYVEKTEYR